MLTSVHAYIYVDVDVDVDLHAYIYILYICMHMWTSTTGQCATDRQMYATSKNSD